MIGCIHCGDSGVLNVVSSLVPGENEWDNRGHASPCHCPAGIVWKEIGLDG